MTDEQAVLTERRGRVLLITLNRPDAMNAINGALSSGLVAAVEELDNDAELTAGVLTGAGRGFSAGMDLKAFSRGEDLGPMTQFIRNGSQKPLIAAIEGFALAGGLELALTCDLLVAAKGVKLGIPEVSVGLFAAAGGLVRLPGRVGFGKAMEMAITGDPITAEDAFALGLVSRLVEKGEAAEVALQLAERVARNAPLAVAAS
jgi:enoyl-CoA hydratase